MYKFTNGVVVYTIEDRDAFIRAGYVLVEEEKKDENDNNDGTISRKHEQSSKATKGFRR